MKEPPTFQATPSPGPDYDPMDRIVQDLVNVESFLSYLVMNPKDLAYLNTHLSGILGLRRSISQQLEMLSDEPYNYPPSRLKLLHEENEKMFTFLEGVVGAMDPWDQKAFKKAADAVEQILLKFDDNLTP